MNIFIITWVLWFASEVLLNMLLRSKSPDKKRNDRGSLQVIWLTIGLANTAGILLTIFVHAPIGALSVAYAGLGIIWAGMIFRFVAVASLGRMFTVDVTIREGHHIKQDGLYRVIRHPSYLGSLVSFAGFGVSLNNWFSLLVIPVLVTAAMLYRISIEEKLLLEQFGKEYESYQQKTWRLIPWVY